MNRSLSYFYIVNYPRVTYFKYTALVLLLPLMYVVSLFELSILTESCPLRVNIFLYLFLVIFIMFISFSMAYYEFRITNLPNLINLDFMGRFYVLILWNYTFILYVLFHILPDWMYAPFSWLNFRIIYWIIVPNLILNATCKALNKDREMIYNSKYFC